MSLLLDALKHAEKNRANQAASLTEESPHGLELSPLTESRPPNESERVLAETQAMLRQRFDLTDSAKVAAKKRLFWSILQPLLLILMVFVAFFCLLRWVLTQHFPPISQPLVRESAAHFYSPASAVPVAVNADDEENLPTIAPELARLTLPFASPTVSESGVKPVSLPMAISPAASTAVKMIKQDAGATNPNFSYLSDLALPAVRNPASDIRVQLDNTLATAAHKTQQLALQNAYVSYQQGKLNDALEQYSQILKTQPDQRDALLGLALLSEKNNELDKSRQYYQRVIKTYPQDETAQAGLLRLQTNVTLSSLRATVQTQPLSHQAAANLATWYAEQDNWTEAQEWYFQAYQLQPQQPDYAYHLAVSLDHLKVKAAAQRYYQEALQLAAQTRGFSFSPDLVQQRLQFLAQEN